MQTALFRWLSQRNKHQIDNKLNADSVSVYFLAEVMTLIFDTQKQQKNINNEFKSLMVITYKISENIKKIDKRKNLPLLRTYLIHL